MFLLPFSRKLNKGIHDIIAVGNIMPQDEQLNLHKVDISSSAPVLVKLLGAVEVEGTDITSSIINSHFTENTPALASRALMNVRINENTEDDIRNVATLKTHYGTDFCLTDEKDGIIIDPQSFIVIRVITQEELTIVSGNIAWMKSENIREL